MVRIGRRFSGSGSHGCEVYSSDTETRPRMLDSVHHTGVRLATGTFRSIPIASLLVDADVLSLELRHQST